MATEKQTTSDRLDDVSSRLTELGSIIKLCAFSAEARRVLTEIDLFKRISPDFEETVSNRIDACNEWMEHDDCLALVLKNAANKIGGLQNLIDCVEA